MKLKTGFITQHFQGEQLMIAAGKAVRDFHGIVRSNETAAFIVDCLKRETTEAAIAEAMLAAYDVDETTVRADVHEIVHQLREIGAIEE